MTSKKINEIAKWCIETAATKTMSGNYIFYSDELASEFEELEDNIISVMDVIVDDIYEEGDVNVLDCYSYSTHFGASKVVDLMLGADIVCGHCKGVCNRSYEECGDCDVMMDLWED